MQRYAISKSALFHQANALCFAITKITEDYTGNESKSLISSWVWFTCQSEAENDNFWRDDAWFQ